MVERIIELSVRYKWVVFGAVFALTLFAADACSQDTARRAAGPLRPAGHRFHRVDGAEPGSGRGPDYRTRSYGPSRARPASRPFAAIRCSA